MGHKFDLIRRRIDGTALQREVEEELRFHVEMCAREYESQGIPAEESLELATRRFGDFGAIKRQCIRISSRTHLRIRTMRVLCAIVLLLGISVSASTTDYRIARIGHILIANAVLATLLTLVKTINTLRQDPKKTPLRLGLDDSHEIGSGHLSG